MFQTGGVPPNDTSANTLSGSVMVNVPVNGAAPESIVTVTVATIAPRTVLSDTCGTATGEILITGCGGGCGGGGGGGDMFYSDSDIKRNRGHN